MLISQGFNPEQEVCQPSWNTANGQKPQTTSPGLSFLPKTSIATPRKRKIAQSSKNRRKMVRNIIRNTLRFIALSMVKKKTTTPRGKNFSKKGQRKKTSLSIQQRITIGSTEKGNFWKK